MTYYDLAISTWDSTTICSDRHCSNGFFPNLVRAIPTTTATLIIMPFMKDFLRKGNNGGDSLTLFTMQQSQEAFAEVWNEPEENIWDQL